MFLLVLALALLLLSDELVLFLIFDNLGSSVQVDFSLRLTAALVLMILNMVLVIFAFGMLKKKPETGAEAMIGMTGVVTRVTASETWVKVRGELWRAQCAQMIAQNEAVRVIGLNGLTLQVEKTASV